MQQSDFRRFTHILAADEANLRNLNRVKPKDATAEVRLWGSYLDGEEIPDPYYGGMVRTMRVPQGFRLITLTHTYVFVEWLSARLRPMRQAFECIPRLCPRKEHIGVE